MKRILIIALFLMACVLIVANSAWPIPPSPPKAAGAGEGDMTKATYDADENSKIDANKVDDLSATYQVALSLLKGTYTNTYLCKYTASGTLLDCNVDPAGFQTANATLTALAAQTESQGALQYYTADATPAVLAKGTAYQLLQMNSGATAPEWTSSLSISALNLTSATSSIPWVVGTATAPTAEGQAYWNSSTDTLTVGNGSTATVIGAGAGDFKADGSVPMTGDLTITQATPDIVLNDSDDAAGTASINANSSGGANDMKLTIGVEDSTGASTPYIEIDGVSETIDFLKPITIGDVTNDNYLKITNNASREPTVSVNELYPEGNVWKMNSNGVEATIQKQVAQKLAVFTWDGGASALTAAAGTKRCAFVPAAATLTGLYASTQAESTSDITIAMDKDAFAAGAHATTDWDIISSDQVVTIPAAGTVLNVNTTSFTATTITAGDQICATITATDTTTWLQLTLYGTY